MRDWTELVDCAFTQQNKMAICSLMMLQARLSVKL